MAKVIRAEVLGFCMGVRRAVELAAAEAERKRGASVYTIGALIHNPKVLSDLEKLGIKILKQYTEIPENSSVIIRAHGISRQLEEELQRKNCRIVDATCPKVKASQLKAQALVRDGYRLFLSGEAEHAEIAGILDYAAEGFCQVVESAVNAQNCAAKLYEKEQDAKTALIGQTTISEEEYSEIGEAIKTYFPALKVIRTICGATKDRQKALWQLLEHVEGVVVAGGKESANTRRLLMIAQGSGKPAVIAENAADVPKDFKGLKAIGLCAGASTPDSLIDEIELELCRL